MDRGEGLEGRELDEERVVAEKGEKKCIARESEFRRDCFSDTVIS
jgi:hypothetical protein